MGVLSKRGLSPVIASVLLILLVLSLSSLVFSWSRGFMNSKGQDFADEVSGDRLCNSVVFDLVIVNVTGDNYNFEVVNRGDVDIGYLKFKIFPGGDSNIVDKTLKVLAGGAVADSVVLSGEVSRVEVFAVLDSSLVGGSSNFVCSDYPVYVSSSTWK